MSIRDSQEVIPQKNISFDDRDLVSKKSNIMPMID
jgi:hypothetical protein